MAEPEGAILTINQLEWAQQNAPELVAQRFAEVTIMADLQKYLRWLNDTGTTTKVLSSLRRQKKRSLGIHPSSVCKKGVCQKRLFFECTGEVQPAREYSQTSQMTFDIGTMLHDTLQTWLKDMYGEQVEVEKTLVDEDLHIIGHTDALFTFELLRAVLEIKSIKEGGNYGWEKVQHEPLEDNVRQANLYMFLDNVPFALVFYMCKNNSEFKEHPLMFDPVIWEDIRKTITPVVEAAYVSGKPPPAKTGWGCKTCDFLHGCAEGKEHLHHGQGRTRFSRVGR